MAINPEAQYPGKITASTAQYPYGQAQNITLPGDGTGTPWEAALVNDLFGFQQALLVEGGVVPSGSAETVTASQYLQALARAGILVWNSQTTYPAGTVVRGSDGVLYEALSEQSGNDPTTPSAFWTHKLKGVPSANLDARYQVFSCAIRNDGGGWAFINDAAHEPVGFTSVSVSGDDIILEYAAQNVTEICSLLVATDETFSFLGIIAGCSVGTTQATLRAYAPLDFTVNTETEVVAAQSFWGSTITADSTTTPSRCVITHPSEASINKAPVFSPAGTDFSRNRAVSTHQGDSITLIGIQNASGFIQYNGSAWVYAGNMLNAPTLVFSAGTLTVTHDETEALDASVTPRGGARRAVLGALTVTSFEVEFYDSTDTLVTTPDTDMRFFFSREGTVEADDIKGSYNVQRGHAQVAANDLVSASGNFWIMGIMEVS